jgi:hypothetical protein
MAATAHYVRVEHDGNGGSRMVDVYLDQTEAVIADGVPPVQVSAPIVATGIVFVDTPDDGRDSEPHQAPRRQFVIVVSGTLECETTDGEVRRFGPGSVVLAADTEGAGHISRIVDPPGRFLMVPAPEA